jgi:hypothetical protein
MDQSLRNKLRAVVTQSRKLLEEAVAQVLQGQFGIYATGKKDEVAVEDAAGLGDLSADDRAFREQILVHLKHVQATGFRSEEKPTAPALVQMVREVAFTHLNRLCAYKMMEARGLIRVAVSRGLKSDGFLWFLSLDGHEAEERLYAGGEQYLAYRHFLEWLGGTLSEEIGVLFSTHDPANRLFPPQRVLEDVLEQINDPELKGIWSEDEAIGWVYQYFTPKEQRDEARKASAAPRNSYELAFRNQFFTPRYVVEFLTDNTLGRIWYEMRKGDTALKDRCKYMVRRPNEVFLSDGEAAPAETPATDDGAARLIHILHRAKKDPRELKILDPACGSGHFLLYCFDLMLVIYLEAYDDPDLGPALKHDYATPEEFKRAIPGLILSRNLHGIDIDLRASQIAALALWLRAQRAYVEFAVPKADRPKVTRSNFVCAEPMPGEEDMLREFLAELYPSVLGQLVKVVFDRMKLAGEAGSLLKIEAEIQATVEEARRQWLAEREQATDRKGNPLLFTRAEMTRLSNRPQTGNLFDVLEVDEQQFWTDAEARVVEALREYARRATNGKGLHRQLFAEDAARGFAFVDVCRKRFDVALMNPPFGEGSKQAKGYIEKSFPRTKNDLYAAFVERVLGMMETGGMVGAITSRTGFFLSSFQKWREEILLTYGQPFVMADLGFGVLDAAKVETAAYCLSVNREVDEGVFFRLLQESDTSATLESTLSDFNRGVANTCSHIVAPKSFRQLPASPFVYWVSETTRKLFKSLPPFENESRTVRQGLATADDFRFVRAWWEVPAHQILSGSKSTTPIDFRMATKNGKRWVPIVKGGVNTPFHGDILLLADWDNDGAALSEFAGSVIRNPEYYFQAGITWPARPWLRGYFSLVPSGALFTHTGMMLFLPAEDRLAICSILNSDTYAGLLHLLMARGVGVSTDQTLKYEVGYVSSVPMPVVNADTRAKLDAIALRCHEAVRASDGRREITHCFVSPFPQGSLAKASGLRSHSWSAHQIESERVVAECRTEINEVSRRLYGVIDTDRQYIDGGLDERTGVKDTDQEDGIDADLSEADNSATSVVSYLVGAALGRWDIRLSTGERQPPPSPEPFAPLPVCSPGMLQGVDGLPADADLPEYPLKVHWEGVLVDDPDHLSDVVRRVREALAIIWKDRADAIEKEACEILGVKELRDYFRKPGKGGFWDDHIARYSKSRRKAPIYWLLQSSKKNYAIWLYCHRLDKDTLFKVLVNTVEPKVRNAERELTEMRTRRTTATGKDIKALDRQIEKQDALVSDLRDFEDKLRRAAELNLTPDLNDGVVLTIAPLRELVPWKEAKAYWEELLAGEYAWSSIGKQLREKGLVK